MLTFLGVLSPVGSSLTLDFALFLFILEPFLLYLSSNHLFCHLKNVLQTLYQIRPLRWWQRVEEKQKYLLSKSGGTETVVFPS